MSTENNAPPTITPQSATPRPDTVPGSGYAARTGAHADAAGRSSGGPVPPPPPPPASSGSGSVAGATRVATVTMPDAQPDDGMERASGESRVSVARAGAVKAAAAALAAAKTAAKKVSASVPAAPAETESPDEIDDRTVRRAPYAATPATAGADDAVHYRASGLSGTALPETGATPAVGPATGTTRAVRAEGPRRVRLAVSRVDPWSAMKLGFLLAVAIGIMTVVATAVVWYVLDGMHVFAKIEDFIQQIVGTETTVNVHQYVAFGRVISLATLIGVVNVVIITALTTIMAFLYNIVASLVGGVHLTLTDD